MYARERLLTANGRLSLANLTATILGQCLLKNQVEHIDCNWSNLELTDNQICYASRDAWALLCLFIKISQSPEPAPLPQSPTDAVGLSVIILTEDHREIAARGKISEAASSNCVDGIKITRTRTVITVTEVLVLATIMSQHQKRSLQDMGLVPFDVVTHRAHVRVVGLLTTAPSPFTMPFPHSPAIPNIQPDTSPELLLPEQDNSDIDGAPLGDLMLDSISSISDDNQVNVDVAVLDHDHESASFGKQTLGSRKADSYDSIIQSCVLKDTFHVFNMLYISRAHGLHIPFAQALRDAIFVPNPQDKQQIEAWLTTATSLKWDDIVRFNSKWLWRRCRRTVGPPETIYPLVHDVFMTWGSLRDAKSHKPLLDNKAWKKAKEILELIRKGFVSDPPGVSLYYIIGRDRKTGGLPIYRNIRGTNFVEGGVHRHLRTMLPSCNTSVRHMVTCLLDFILRHNLL
ncbi:hypothetical protein H0H92_010711, partial [Tricholoma furcatifolium]